MAKTLHQIIWYKKRFLVLLTWQRLKDTDHSFFFTAHLFQISLACSKYQCFQVSDIQHPQSSPLISLLYLSYASLMFSYVFLCLSYNFYSSRSSPVPLIYLSSPVPLLFLSCSSPVPLLFSSYASPYPLPILSLSSPYPLPILSLSSPYKLV